MTATVDLVLLQSFVAVARSGSIGLAAGELHLSQASVSRHLQRLETAIGAELFVRREGRALELTDAGSRILEPSAELLEQSERRWNRLRELALATRERIVVGMSPAIALLPEATTAVQRFHQDHPDLDLQVVERLHHRETLRELATGELDVAVAQLEDADVTSEIVVAPVAPVYLHATVPNGHRLADRERVAVAELAGETFAFRDDSPALPVFERLCGEAGIVPRIAHRCHELMTLVTLLTSGEAITVSWTARGPAPGPLAERFRTIPLDVDLPPRRLAVFWSARREATDAMRDLVRYARDVAAQRGGGAVRAGTAINS